MNQEEDLSLGDKYLSEMDYEQAIVELDKLIEVDPKNLDAYIGLTQAYAFLENKERAVDIINKSIAVFGLSDNLIEKLNQVQLLKEYIDTIIMNDYEIQWEDKAFESLIREAIKRPKGPIKQSDLLFIKRIEIIGDQYVNVYHPTVMTEKKSICQTYEDKVFICGEDLNSPSRVYEGKISKLNDLVHFPFLEELVIQYQSIHDVSQLQKLTNLKEIDLSYNYIERLDQLSLRELTHLNLSYNQLDDITPLSTFKSLCFLSLRENNIRDISALALLNNLVYINLRNNIISDLTPLSQLVSIERLDLSGNMIESIDSLSKLSSLYELNLSGNRICELEPLSELREITSLDLSGNKIEDILSLKKMHNMIELNINDNRISSIEVLNRFKDLCYLYMNNNRVLDISPISLTPLFALSLAGNQVTDISAISQLRNLEYLDLENNLITDITSLEKLNNLTHLKLNYNQIKDVTPLSELNNLLYIELEYNEVTDWSAIEQVPVVTGR